MSSPRDQIRTKALELGFDAVGFARAASTPQARAALERFVADGMHGDMGWLAENADRRADPNVLWPAARSAVLVALNYGPDRNPLEVLTRRDRGAISVYAGNRDYHDVLKKKLRVLARWMHETFHAEVKLFV